jgi:hypothetical protein
MIDAVQRYIYDALARTADGSTLPADEQDRLLAQASVEACQILTQWLDSFEWEELRPSSRAPIGDAIPDWERIKQFLSPLKETLTRIAARQSNNHGTQEIFDPADYVDKALEAARQTAGRYRRRKRDDLFRQAGTRINSLRTEVCDLATGFADKTQSAARRKRARSVLAKVAGLLLTLSLAMAGASPSQMRQNIPEWGHDAVRVLFVHNIAAAAQPGVPVTLPQLGPQIK